MSGGTTLVAYSLVGWDPVLRDCGEWSDRSEGLRADGSTFAESKLVTSLDDGQFLIAVAELDDAALVADE